jgi:hypothetical protein
MRGGRKPAGWWRSNWLNVLIAAAAVATIVLAVVEVPTYVTGRPRHGTAHAPGAGSQPPRPSAETGRQPPRQVGIPDNPLADGTAYYVSVAAPELGSSEWKYGRVGMERRVFRAPKDGRKWVEFYLCAGDHFRTLSAMISDFRKKVDFKDADATKAREGQALELETPSFRVVITLEQVDTRADPDPEKPYDRVFEKVFLRVVVSEKSPP